TDSAPAASGSFSYTAAAGDGSYSFYTKALDKAGNYETAPASADTTTLLDTQPPTSSATSPQYSTPTAISVSYRANDPGANASGLDKVELWAKAPGESAFSKVATEDRKSAGGGKSCEGGGGG